MKHLIHTLIVGLALGFTASAHGQDVTAGASAAAADVTPGHAASRRASSSAQLMTPAEIDATGIRDLEPEQLAALSAWLQRYEMAVAQRIYETTEADFAPPSPVIETQIDGSFDGWVGDTVFRLANGQIWQQVSPSAKYATAQSPKVTITRAPYLMHVDGVSIDIEVQRIK